MQTKHHGNNQPSEEQTEYTFIREDGRWYIHLTAHVEQVWSKQDLELAAGAHKVLNTLSNGSKKLRLQLSLQPFEGANVLELVEHCSTPKGGGVYLYNPWDEQNSSLYWICDLALFVFGDIPERIYVKRLPLKEIEVEEAQMATSYTLHQNQNTRWLKEAV